MEIATEPVWIIDVRLPTLLGFATVVCIITFHIFETGLAWLSSPQPQKSSMVKRYSLFEPLISTLASLFRYA
jgi:hypothetical protein